MAIFGSMIITDSGNDLMADVIANEDSIIFTRVVIGDGEYSAAEKSDAALKARTALKSLKQGYDINSEKVSGADEVRISALMTNYDPVAHTALIEDDMYLNEIGLMAKGSKSNTEVLFCIAICAGAHGDYIPGYDGNNPTELLQDFVVYISNETNVTVEFSSSAYALARDLQRANDNISDHIKAAVTDMNGVHGIRINDKNIQYKDPDTGQWIDAEGGGGTTIVQIPSVTVGTYTYNGSSQGPDIGAYDDSQIVVTNAKKIDAGTYTLTLSLIDSTKMVWSDLTTAAKTYEYTIDKRTVTFTAPTVTASSLTYDGNEKTLTSNMGSCTEGGQMYYYTSDYTQSSAPAFSTETWSETLPTVRETDAGTYYIWYYCYVSDTDNNKGTNINSVRSVSKEIKKATGSITKSETSVSLTTSTTYVDVTITPTGDGTLTVTTDDISIATVSKRTNNTYRITGLATGSTSIKISLSEGVNYTSASSSISVSVQFVSIYGVSWDGTSTTKWSRTDAAAEFVDPTPVVGTGNGSSPFDDLMPWSGMKKEERTGGTMVSIPKFWYKITQNGNGIKIQIADSKTDGYSVSPAHMDRGDGKGERDAVYVGRYHCGSSTKKSKTGETPYNNATRQTMRTALHDLGSNLWQIDFATRFTIWLLYIVEFADWNSQDKIGYGCGNNSGVQAMGYTDSMEYHTGTTQSSRTTYGLGTQYRYIEGLWDNVFDWLDGCYYNSSGLNIILNPNNFSDTSGGTVVGVPSSGYPSKFTVSSAGGYPLFYPTEASGSDSTYSCDYWSFDASGPCLCGGGNYGQGTNRGLFYVSCSAASDASVSLGCRLLELP